MKKSFSKLICCAIAVAMLITLIPVNISMAAKVELKTTNGLLDVEAEDLDYEKGRLEEAKDKKMYSGGKALTVPAEDKTDPKPEDDPDIDLSFVADVDGTYNVWVRAYAETDNMSGNSIYLAYNGGGYAYTPINGKPEIAAWTKLCSVTVKAGETADVRFRIRHSYLMAFDRFIITNNVNYTPDDVVVGLATPTPEPTPFKAPDASKVKIKTENGSAIVEIEDLKFDDSRYTKEKDKRYSGGEALTVNYEDKNVPPTSQDPALDLTFVADKPGTYNVWLYAYATQGYAGNSQFISVNGEQYKSQVIQGEPDVAAWTKIANAKVTNAGEVVSVRVIPRQNYQMALDKVIVTSNATFSPSGIDPDPNSSSVTELPEGVYPMPSILPPAGEHPRLFFTKDDVATIKANLSAEQNAEALKNLNAHLAYETDGTFPASTGTHNYDNGRIFNTIEAHAFNYAINGDTESGKKAISMMKNALASSDFAGYGFAVRVWGRTILTTAKVYDWCYDLLSADDKTYLAAAATNLTQNLSTGYPPNKMGSICGHGSEGMFLVQTMAMAIALYDEYPSIYNYTAGRLFSDYVPVRNYVYQSGAYHQGSAYVRYENDIICATMFKQMLGIDIFEPGFQDLCYEMIYRRRPDGQVLRSGDDWNEYGQNPSTFWSTYGSVLFMASAYYDDPYLKREYQKIDANMASEFGGDEGIITTAVKLIINDPELKGASNTALPKTKYTYSPTATMIARTGWDDGYNSPDVMAYTKIGGRWAANHEHLDAGHFQLYYKGILASDSGYYGAGYGHKHDYNYHKRSVAHNTLAIYNPNEELNYYGLVANDGGQRTPMNGTEPANLDTWMNEEYETGEVTGYESGPNPYDPEYSYISGDITKAYSDKVSEVLRSTVLLPLDDADHPATFVVFDKVTSSNKSFKKSWLLHMQEEPEVSGNKTIVKRTTYGYNGRMVNETLLPKSVTIEKIGGEGKQFWIDGANYDYAGITTNNAAEVGWGRVEISPAEANETDYFLNVMTVSDADTTAADIESKLIEGANYAGAVIKDRVAVFAKDKERIADSLTFTIPGSGEYKVFVAGLKAGTWSVGGQSVVVTEDGGVAFFTANAGTVSLKYNNAAAERNDNYTAPNTDAIGIKVKNMFIYSDVPAFIENGRTLVPLRAIFEAIDAEVSYDGATATATAVKSGRVVKITKDSTTAYIDDVAFELDQPAMIKDDRFVVPVRFVSEAFNCRVVWDDFARCVYVTPGIIVNKNEAAAAGQAKIVNVIYSDSFNGESGEYTFDGDTETLWSVEGDGQWIYWEINEASISSAYIVLNKATERKAKFDLEVSMDGETWTKVGEYESNGSTEGELFKFNPVNAKFLRFVGHGNNSTASTLWNAIKEIQINLAE